MSDLIDRERLIEICGDATEEGKVTQALLHAPTIDAVPVVHGHWDVGYVFSDDGNTKQYYRCSKCKSIAVGGCYQTRYCPHCGAKMDERREETE